MNANVFALPHPKAKFFLGHLPSLSKERIEFLTQCAREYGDIVPLRLGNTPALFLNRPEYIEQVLNNRKLFVKKGNALRRLLGEGLITSEGESWFRQRRLIQPVFHQKQIATYADVMVANTEQMLEDWQNGEIRNVHQDMMSLTLNIIVKTIFSIDLSHQEAKTIAFALDIALEYFQKMPGQNPLQWLPTPESWRVKRAIEALDRTIYNIISQRRNSNEAKAKTDLLSMLMQTQDEADGSVMSDKQLRDEVATLIFAGHETTANALSWMWILLSEHPQVQSKLLTELTAVLGDRYPTLADIPNLPYTNMVIKEAMRLYPPVPLILRKAAQNCEIGGYFVPAECVLLMSQWTMHRHPSYFKDPDLFIPERWANDLEKQLPKGVYFPFGDGSRICIGKNFALIEAVLIVATIAPKFQISLSPNQQIVPQASISLRPKHGLKVVITERYLLSQE
ncbi:Unspecific monooxygenase [Hyella patelloides LEGE 07179]|uniref:Unspecific monooxygenase n=1 Tax=Hyella patelloides LEGE 07179 TaxID=945734 RepID=A0A563W190_9CYAN|nr:cytochrome P450 [Hyella patelloides]VEP17474.1 Unspecific monooxygenase [Hyella patelloides LEGE 07179]